MASSRKTVLIGISKSTEENEKQAQGLEVTESTETS